MAIVTISHEMGSGGAEIGMTAATRLGYTYVDHELLLKRAQRYGLAADRLSHLADSQPSWAERFDGETRRYIVALQAVLWEFAQDGSSPRRWRQAAIRRSHPECSASRTFGRRIE
jgi:hypothetical protein